MVDERTIALVEEVLEKTKARKLNWQATARPGVFIAAMGGKYMIKISPGSYPYDETYVLTLQEGDDVLLKCTAESTSDPLVLDKLHDLIHNQVLRVDEKNKSIDQAISVLKNL
jgi:hypothetical protein